MVTEWLFISLWLNRRRPIDGVLENHSFIVSSKISPAHLVEHPDHDREVTERFDVRLQVIAEVVTIAESAYDPDSRSIVLPSGHSGRPEV